MAGPVTLRTASLADCELVFDWANDPVTRAMSFNQAQITRAEHVAWFAASSSATNIWRRSAAARAWAERCSSWPRPRQRGAASAG